MVEVIFILVTIYFAYVVHNVTSNHQPKQAQTVASAPPLLPVVNTASKKVATDDIATKAKPGEKNTSSIAEATKIPGGRVRNPETGEIAKMANSYRMCKRWIKEALVAEGFLDKVYKANELDEDTKIKINKALGKLMAMENYHA